MKRMTIRRNKIWACMTLLMVPVISRAQAEWTWMAGVENKGTASIYGTKGVPDTTNQPSARLHGASWADRAGNIWIFGGSGTGVGTRLNDMWRYNPSTKEWTWMNGEVTGNPLGSYKTPVGIASADNSPGGRQYLTYWTDNDGNFWLFGAGTGYAASGKETYLNDLWKYDPVKYTWTLVKGDSSAANQKPNYGTIGVPNANNIPGGRQSGITWTDTSGNLWLFGGYGNNVKSASASFLNDLWKYDIAANTWTWVDGSDSVNVHGRYGTMGVADTNNYPGCRRDAASWMDEQGNLWMFGGQGAAKKGPQNLFLNDLWKYNLSTKVWTWVSGADTVSSKGIYGKKGVPGNNNIPGGREVTNTYWKDAAGDFWLFGGRSYGAIGTTYDGINDLWKYSVKTNEWTWYTGDTINATSGAYGTKGVKAPGNTPGGRSGVQGSLDSKGNFWLLGGYGYGAPGLTAGTLNDLWKLEFCTELKQPSKIEGPEAVCIGASKTYSTPTLQGAKSYYWILPSGWTGSSTTNSIDVTAGEVGGTISVAIVDDCDTSIVQSLVVNIDEIKAVINVEGFVLSTVGVYTSYQWFLDGVAIPGATSRSYAVTENGAYTVSVTNENGCSGLSEAYPVSNYTTAIRDEHALAAAIKIYPNPTSRVLHILAPVAVNLILSDITGKQIKMLENTNVIYCDGLSEGVYLLHVMDGNGYPLKTEKIVIQGR